MGECYKLSLEIGATLKECIQVIVHQWIPLRRYWLALSLTKTTKWWREIRFHPGILPDTSIPLESWMTISWRACAVSIAYSTNYEGQRRAHNASEWIGPAIVSLSPTVQNDISLQMTMSIDQKLMYAFRGWIAFVAFMDLGVAFRSFIEKRCFLGEYADTKSDQLIQHSEYTA